MTLAMAFLERARLYVDIANELAPEPIQVTSLVQKQQKDEDAQRAREANAK